MSSVTRPLAFALLASLALAACERQPTSPGTDEPTAKPTVDGFGWAVDTASGPISSLLVLVDPAQFRLEDIGEGHFRFRVLDPDATAPRPGEVIHGLDGDSTYLRRVLEVEREGDVLTVATGSAYVHDVLRGGRFALDREIAPGAPGVAMSREPLAFDTAFALDSLDLCEVIATRRGSVVCGSDKTIIEKGVIELDGRIDTLMVEAGFLDVSAELDAAYTLDPGGQLVPGTGRAPVFTPCNTAPSAPGCLARVGSALRSFLGSVGIDPNVLPPARVCVPGTPIVTRPVQWWPYRAPVVQVCRISDWGALPEFTLPALKELLVTIRPRIHADMIVNMSGGGTLELTIPVPTLSKVKCFDHGNGFLCLKIGLVMPMSFSADGLATRVHFDDLEHDRITMRWTDTEGWTRQREELERDHNIDMLRLELPDTLSIRVGAAVTAEINLCLGPNAKSSCVDENDDDADGAGILLDFRLGAVGEVTIGNYIEMKTHLDDEFLNLHAPLERYNALEMEFGILLPKILIQPDKNLHTTWPEFDCCHMDLGSYHETGTLGVRTTTTGALPDPDGYRVLVRRVDTLPALSPAGTRRIGLASWQHPFDEPIGVSDSFRLDPWPMCRVIYSDALLASTPISPFHLVPLARRHGINAPNFVMDVGCDLIPADYEVELVDVADNCTVTGARVRETRVRPSYLEPFSAPVEFAVDCPAASATPGGIDVTVATTGFDPFPADYGLRVDGGAVTSAAINGNTLLAGLDPRADREVELLGVPGNCHLDGPNPVLVNVVGGETATARFDVECFPIVVEQEAPGTILVTTVTTGDNLDPDGYALALDGGTARPVATNGTSTYPELQVGQHLVALTGLAPNCSTTSPNPATVQVTGGAVSEVTFALNCGATDLGDVTGSVAVSITTTGARPDPDGYTLWVGSLDGEVGVTGSTTVPQVGVGEAVVRLAGVAPQCRVQGEHPRSVAVHPNQSTPVSLAVSCDEATVTLAVTTTGTDLDPDGFGVLVDGEYLGTVPSTGTATLGPLTAGAHALTLVQLAPNCAVTGAPVREFTSSPGGSASLALSVDCAPMGSLGSLSVSAWALGTGSLAGVRVMIDGIERGTMLETNRALVPQVRPGDRIVALDGLPDGCSVASDHPLTVRVPARWPRSVTFLVRCEG